MITIKRVAALLVVLVLLAGSQTYAERIQLDMLLTAVTTTGAGATFTPNTGRRTFQVYGRTTAGAGAATVVIEVSNANVDLAPSNADWITAGTVSLTLGTTRVSDGFTMTAGWRHVRARVTAISGTGALVNVAMGTEVAQ